MTEKRKGPAGPDLTKGVRVTELRDKGALVGHVGDDEVLLVHREGAVFAVGAHCTHYHGPLVDGLVIGETVRCPWHHACFDLRTGEPLRPPALDPIACWRVDRDGDRVVVTTKAPAPPPRHMAADAKHPESIVIVGAGAAGFAAADMLRREGYDGPVTMVSADADAPYDRPNLSKDLLAGTAREDWMPLRRADYYATRQVTLSLNTRVTALDTTARQLTFENGTTQPYGSLLLAVGADPVKLTVPGADGRRIHYLRSFADSRAIIQAASAAKRAVVIGASFIGLEVAASLRTRGLEVHVVAPDARPMEKILGADLGDFVRTIHERHGVVFHLGETVASIDDRSVALTGGASLDADLIAVGIGVRPVVGFIEKAGIAVDRGVNVDEYLETSAAGVFAAGDIARWPDPHTGERIRVEHWVVAERQGQTAARNILGMRERFEAVPFFWSQHYDVTINYVGHADKWDTIELDGDIEKQDCALTYRREGRALAVATVGRDLASLQGEVELERWTYRP